jgi:RNA polymerase sigma-70 factor, ECF subfamily
MISVEDAGPRISERQLLRAARAGDRGAFADLVRLRVPASFQVAASVIGDDANAADAVQNAFVAAWRELPRLKDLDLFDPWLRRILINECRMQLRQAAHRPSVGDPEHLGELVGASPRSPRAEVLDLLDHAFDRLEPDERILLALYVLERRSLGEIAQALRMPQGTVKLRLHDAREALYLALESTG